MENISIKSSQAPSFRPCCDSAFPLHKTDSRKGLKKKKTAAPGNGKRKSVPLQKPREPHRAHKPRLQTLMDHRLRPGSRLFLMRCYSLGQSEGTQRIHHVAGWWHRWPPCRLVTKGQARVETNNEQWTTAQVSAALTRNARSRSSPPQSAQLAIRGSTSQTRVRFLSRPAPQAVEGS